MTIPISTAIITCHHSSSSYSSHEVLSKLIRTICSNETGYLVGKPSSIYGFSFFSSFSSCQLVLVSPPGYYCVKLTFTMSAKSSAASMASPARSRHFSPAPISLLHALHGYSGHLSSSARGAHCLRRLGTHRGSKNDLPFVSNFPISFFQCSDLFLSISRNMGTPSSPHGALNMILSLVRSELESFNQFFVNFLISGW